MCELFLTALPKTGTHLMRQLLNTQPFEDTLLPVEQQPIVKMWEASEYREDISLVGDGRRHQHIPFTAERGEKLKDAVGFMIVRDPRDVIVSHAYYVAKLPEQTWINYKVSKTKRLSDLPFKSRIDFLIQIIKTRLIAYSGWAMQENVHVFKYRELVHDKERQLKRMMAILDQRGLLDADYTEMCDRARPRGDGAFRRGQVGDYEHDFTDFQKRSASAIFHDFIEAWS